MAMTFNSLIQDIQDELEVYNDLFVSKIPTFINDAIDQINLEAKNIGLEQYVTSFFEAGQPVIAKPGRWRRNITFNFGTGPLNNTRNIIKLMSYEFVNMYTPDAADATKYGPPQYYCDYGFFNFKVAPTPDQAYPFEISYMELPSQLSESIQQNWLTDYAPMLLKYGALLQATIWLQDPEQQKIMEDNYRKYLAPFNDQDSARLVDRSSYRQAD